MARPGLDPAGEDRIRALLPDDLSAAAVHRIVTSGSDGLPPIRVSYPVVTRAVARLRSERPLDDPDLSPAGMAGRILRQLDRELRRIETAAGKVDLERLDRIAATLRRIEPIRPKAEDKKAASLRSLLPTAESQDQAAEG